MFNNRKNIFNNFTTKTNIFLSIIAVLFIILFIYDKKTIVPGLLIYISIVTYTFISENKRNKEISNHVQELLITMDSTAKKTLINSPLPLIIVETDGNVIWRSSKFVYEFANIDIKNHIDDLVKEIKMDIQNRRDDNTKNIEKQVQIGNSIYKVLGEYVKSKNGKKNENEYMAILYFIDITEQIKSDEKYKDANQCIGIICVDNYEEIMQRISDEDRPAVIAEIEKRLYDWAAESGGLMIKTDRNKFIYMFEHKYLEQIQESKFSILDTIKEIDLEGRIQLTLSIAISDEGNSNYEKYKASSAAMDIVLGRGGDQAVVKTNGKYKFYGGTTQEVEKRTKVKARMFAQALEELVIDSQNVMIMGHTNGDMDSIGSALGIYRLAKSIGKEAYVVCDTYGESLKTFIDALKESDEEYQENVINRETALSKISSETLLVIVDTHKKNYVDVPELLEKTEKIVVIDHHRRSTDYIENDILNFQEVYASSAAELVTEILQYTEKEVDLKNIEVEALYAGIMMDTKNFTFKTGVRTFEAAAYLRKKGIDIIKVKKWFQSDFETYNSISKIVENSEIVRNSIAISIYEDEADAGVMCAKAADELLTISNITASFVLGKVDNKIYISGRSIGDINVQIILEKLGGGGHITLAGAQLEDLSLEEAKQQLMEKIDEYYEENM